jgi:hypothetical protein
MKKEDIPQDESALSSHTREICYAQGEDGSYGAELSTGWEPKSVALDQAWEEIEHRKLAMLEGIKNEELSPISFFMEKNLMDIQILASYTGFFKFTVKKHLKYGGFQKLPIEKLEKYAEAFEIKVEELTNFDSEKHFKQCHENLKSDS